MTTVLQQFLSTLAAVAAYTISFIFLLGLRVIRKGVKVEGDGAWLASLVGGGCLVGTLVAEASVLIFLDRSVAGRLYYLATFLGAIMAFLSTIGVISKRRPRPVLNVAMEMNKSMALGLTLGNVTIVLSNLLSNSTALPSLL